MTFFSHHRRISVVAIVLAVMCTVGTAAESADKDPMQLVPADSLFCVRINNVNQTLTRLDQFLTGIAPFSASMMVRGQMGQMLGGMEAQGVDMAGDFAVFGPLPGGEAPDPSRIGILVPISSYQQFVEGNPNVTAPDAQGISRIGPQGEQSMAAVQVGDYALVTSIGSQEALPEVKNWVTGGGTTALLKRLDQAVSKDAADTPIWAYVNMQTVSKMFGPMIQAKMQEARQAMQKAQSEAAEDMPFNPSGLMDMYMSMLNSLMQETQFLSLSLSPAPAVARLGLTVAAVPETDMARFLSPRKQADRQLQHLGYLQNGAVMNFAASSDPESAGAMMEAYKQFSEQIMGAMLEEDEAEEVMVMMEDWLGVFGGSASWSFAVDPSGKPPFAAQYVAEIDDEVKLGELLEKAADLIDEDGAIAKFYEKMGLKVELDLKEDVETYKGVSIDALTFSMDAVGMDADAPQAQMIGAMYGGDWNLRLAVVDKLLLYVLSNDPSKAIRGMIDQAKSGGPGQVPSEVQAAMDLIPDAKDADFFATYNYLRILKLVTAMMPMPMPATQMQSQSNIALAGNIDAGKLSIQAALPKQHLQEVMMAFMQMQQQMQQQRQQEMDDQM